MHLTVRFRLTRWKSKKNLTVTGNPDIIGLTGTAVSAVLDSQPYYSTHAQPRQQEKKLLTGLFLFAIIEWGVRAAGKAAAGGIHYNMDPLRTQAFC